MAGCCEGHCSLDVNRERQRRTLIAVLIINALMFVVILLASLRGQSSALLADSLDNLGDALTYGLSLLVVAGSVAAKARVALFKGVLILLGACVVLGQLAYRLVVPGMPVFEIMGLFSLLGLAANSLTLALLWRHRNEDVNMSSVWECSRNDIASNLSVFIAAAAVWLAEAAWPDMLVALLLASLLLRSAARVIGSALDELRDAASQAH